MASHKSSSYCNRKSAINVRVILLVLFTLLVCVYGYVFAQLWEQFQDLGKFKKAIASDIEDLLSQRNVYNSGSKQNISLLEAHLLTSPNCTVWDTNEVIIIPICVRKDLIYSPTLLVLMTSMTDLPNRRHIHENTMRLWLQLGSQVRPLLFVTEPVKESGLVFMACKYGFDVYVAPLCDRNKLPVLKAMFNVSQTVVPQASFYGYANGDIIFESGLVNTLRLLDKYKYMMPTMLIIGRKMDIKIHIGKKFESIKEVKDLALAFGKLDFVVSMDYFISSNGGFPWQSIPKVVIGRRAYDNFLMYYANSQYIHTIDSTETILAVHLGGQEGKLASHAQRKDIKANEQILGPFDFTQGLITCAHFRTLRSLEGQVELFKVIKGGFCGIDHWTHQNQFDRYMADTVLQPLPKL